MEIHLNIINWPKMVIKSILIVLCLYIYIYNPIFQILEFGSIKILLGVSLIYLLLSGKLKFFIILFRKELAFTFFIIVYSLLIEAFNGPAGIGMIYRHFLWFIEGFTIPFFLVYYFKDHFLKYGYVNLVIFVGLIASLITLFLILNPTINQIVRSDIIIDSIDTYTDTWTFRGFTIAENSSFSYGVVQGIILGFCLFQLKRKYYYIIPILTIFISIIFNARIGISLIILALILIIGFRRFNVKKSIVLVLFLVLLFTLIDFTPFVVQNSVSIEWGLDFFNQTRDLLSGKGENNTYDALGNMFFFPEKSREFLFGTGEYIYIDAKKTSDIGYIIQIFEGGFVYLLLMFTFLFLMYKRVVKIEKDIIFPLFLIIAILIANMKGNALFVSTGFFRLFTLYYVHIILKKHARGF